MYPISLSLTVPDIRKHLSLSWRIESFSSILKFFLNTNQKVSLTGSKDDCSFCRERIYICSEGRSFVVSARESFFFVRQHEIEHLTDARMRARQNGKKVVGQELKMFESVCPACNKRYVSRGCAITKTVTVSSKPVFSLFPNDMKPEGKGREMDAYA
jgi:hypothetical protein